MHVQISVVSSKNSNIMVKDKQSNNTLNNNYSNEGGSSLATLVMTM